MLSSAHIVGSIAALTLIYFVIYPVAWYIWDPWKLRRFPAPSFLASISPIRPMSINVGEKRSYRVHEAHQRLGPIIRVGPNTVYFNEPQAVNDIYGHKAVSKMIKDTFYDRLAGDYHDIVQERDRGEHSRKRKYLAHAFALKTVVEMEPVIRANAMNLIARIEDFIADMAGHTGG